MIFPLGLVSRLKAMPVDGGLVVGVEVTDVDVVVVEVLDVDVGGDDTVGPWPQALRRSAPPTTRLTNTRQLVFPLLAPNFLDVLITFSFGGLWFPSPV
jgi:hypothetical protein